MPPQMQSITSQREADEQQQPQSQDERNDNESPSVVTEELRRQVSEMQIEMQRQAARHEEERLQWKEERQSLTTLLRQQRTSDKTAVFSKTDPQNSQPKQSLSLSVDINEDMQTTGSGLPQATKMLPSQAKSDSSLHISIQPEVSETSLETTGEADRNIVTRFIKLSPLLPKEKSAFNDILISREDKLLKRMTERRAFGHNGVRTDGNRKRRVTPMLLSKSRVFKSAPNTTQEHFSRESTISAMGQQRIVDQLSHCLLELEKQKESQLPLSRGQTEAIEQPILPTSREVENPTIESKIQAKEHGDMTMNCQANIQSFENVQGRAREFEKTQNYLDAKAQFYHIGTDRLIRMPTSLG